MLFILGLLGLWRFGTRGYLWCVGIGTAGMILTKETYIIHIQLAESVYEWIALQYKRLELLLARPLRRRYRCWPLGLKQLRNCVRAASSSKGSSP